MKKIKHMCPICGKTEFSDENSFEICDYCGWEDDGLQEDCPNEWGGANELSKNDYAKLYQETIKMNPRFKWSKDNKTENFERYNNIEHNCPVCGKTVFKHNNSHDRCKYCGWIDNWVQEEYPNFDNSSNKLSLKNYIVEYNNKIEDNPKYEWVIEHGKYDFTEEEESFIESLNLEYKVNKVMTNEESNDFLIILEERRNEENTKKIDAIIDKILEE